EERVFALAADEIGDRVAVKRFPEECLEDQNVQSAAKEFEFGGIHWLPLCCKGRVPDSPYDCKRKRGEAQRASARRGTATRGPVGFDGGGEAAAGSEFAGDLAPGGMDGGFDVAQHAVDGVLVKNSQVAVGEQVHLQGLEFEAELGGLIANRDGAVVGQAGLRADGCVLGEFDRDLVAAKMVGPGIELGECGVDAGASVRGGVVGHGIPFKRHFIGRYLTTGGGNGHRAATAAGVTASTEKEWEQRGPKIESMCCGAPKQASAKRKR